MPSAGIRNIQVVVAAAAAAAKLLRLCPTLCDPIDGSPPGSPVPGILQARTLECIKTRSLHHLRRPQASFRSPEGEETLKPPQSDLRSPGIISKHGGFHAPDGDSAGVERERDMGRPVFRGTDPNSLFSRVCFYTLRCYVKVMWGQQS